MSTDGGSPEKRQQVSRRDFLRLGGLAAAGAFLTKVDVPSRASLTKVDVPSRASLKASAPVNGGIEEATIAELQAAMESGQLTSVALTNIYLSRIKQLDQHGPKLNTILEINPEALKIAAQLDKERQQQGARGPLHGIPIVLKDNIDTADQMQTTAGSLALVGDPPPLDATVADRLRQAGAVILAKANLSEWANFRSFHSSSGWSGRGGQTRNPYILDRNPCGSSSGSAAATAANLCAAALGTETDGSVVCPSNNNAVAGIKPTVGLTSRAGVVPISHTQDTVGTHGRTVADAATVLGALTGVDPRDPATAESEGHFYTDYTQFLDPNGLQGARIGVPRNMGFTGYSEETDALFDSALQAMADAGATIVDPADFFNADVLLADDAELVVLVYEFKRDLNAYLATRTGVPIQTLADAIAFNLDHADVELKWFQQEWFDLAESDPYTEEDYLAALERGPREAGPEGIDAVLAAYDLDALVAPTGSPGWTTDLVNGDHFLGASSWPAAMAGYPLLNMPAGYSFGLPVGISFMGTAWSEPTLIKLASGFEAATGFRQPPQYLPTIPIDAGVPPRPGGLSQPSQLAGLLNQSKPTRRTLIIPGR